MNEAAVVALEARVAAAEEKLAVLEARLAAGEKGGGRLAGAGGLEAAGNARTVSVFAQVASYSHVSLASCGSGLRRPVLVGEAHNGRD